MNPPFSNADDHFIKAWEIAENTDIGEVNRAITASRVPDSSFDEGTRLLYNEKIRKLAEYIGLDTDKIKDNSEKLEFLLEWSKGKSNSDDVVDALYELKKIRDKVGFQEIGETALKRLYQYVRLSDEQVRLFRGISKIKKEKELIIDESKSQGEHTASD